MVEARFEATVDNSLEAIDPQLAEQIGYSGTQTAKVVGISYRQLDYWARTDLIRPSLTDAAGSGSRRRYSYTRSARAEDDQEADRRRASSSNRSARCSSTSANTSRPTSRPRTS